MPEHPPQKHDLIVIGASAGGVEALMTLLHGLPGDLRAALMVVLHLDPTYESRLPELLAREGGLPAAHARSGEPIEAGRIYVAPSDRHLLVRPGHVEVARGPRENGHRPAVNALFRTAARAYGSRVIGVVLTGHLNCGTEGLLSIKARRGLAVVQDPRDAAAPGMPTSAIQHVAVDHVVPVREMSKLLVALVKTEAPQGPEQVPAEVALMEGAALGHDVELVCPSCLGKLTKSTVAGYETFRCHVGHSFSLQSLATEQGEQLEVGSPGTELEFAL